jgi:hypothetical protein
VDPAGARKEAIMTVHQCPKCELRFSYKTELDDHCWHDHPEFRHEYPATRPKSVRSPDEPRAREEPQT